MMETPALDAGLPPPAAGACDVLVIAGEHSGDQHAARMVAEACAADPSLRVCALGGEELARAGAQLLHDLTASSVVGVAEVLKHYGYFKRLFEQCVDWIAEHRPRAICFVDYPGFNLRLAKRLVRDALACKGGGEVRLLYYISPQVWAWKKKRRFVMAEYLDALAVIFPFETAVYEDTRLPVTYVGHPFASENYALPVVYAAEAPVLLLPGSRRQPVRRIFPVMLQAWARYRERNPEASATVIYPGEGIREELETALSQVNGDLRASVHLRAGNQPTSGSAVLMSSGTMSLNVALAGIPGAIVYRAHPMTYLFGRIVVSIPYLGIANLLLERPAWPEFIQGAARAEALAERLHFCLEDTSARAQAFKDAEALSALLSTHAEIRPGAWLLRHLN